MKIAGIDIGTTGCKCTVYEAEGTFVCEAYREYAIHVTPEAHTIDVNMVWEQVQAVLSEVAQTAPEIEAICVSSFGEASILLDDQDRPLMESYLFTDPNGVEEWGELVAQLGEDYIYDQTGLPSGHVYSVIKWRYLAKHKPEILKKCTHIALFADYMLYRLCGVRQIDYTLAARTLALDRHTLGWNEAILAWGGVTGEMLPKPVPTGTPAAPLHGRLQEELGFQNRPLLVSGCHDQIAAVIGCGALQADCAVDGSGTVECISAVCGREAMEPERLRQGGHPMVPFLVDLAIVFAFSYTGGALLKWYRDALCPLEHRQYQSAGLDSYEQFNREIDPDHPSGLLVLPYFAGAGTPYMDNQATGAILGLSTDTTKGQIYQALMEGVANEMKLNMDSLAQAGIDSKVLYATGGGANSKEWLQMKADILGKPVISLGAAQTGTVGCIMLASVACGVCTTLHQAAQRFVRYGETYHPRPQMVQAYAEKFQQYQAFYPSIKYLMR